VAFIDEVKKPIVVTWNSFKTDEQGVKTSSTPACPMFRSSATASRHCAPSPATNRRRCRSVPAGRLPSRLPKEAAAALGRTPAATSPSPLGADASRRLLESFGVPLAGEGLVHSAAEAAPHRDRDRLPRW